ncbi:glycosyltransferase [Flavilitoribacter nigricans]|uniref:Glycosyltransferase n=1 Tax=Flavilitoribacter nigricans (strain ATCC 23147 / DSM 23189 / NBRC 102662 / NCIMB 1420 / SS-2) TaxID=1122177 RepID=A0A2D0NAX8_FLAN2|nr:glycosyltransferase [Flavilitoribacter nigricans]PHN05671.1 glycosyltransferase [Flavilitoribacter nigricans DSM 23189 = NBRC 102662]
MTFDITIPVLNEEASLQQQVGKLHDFVSAHFPDTEQWQIIIADNGSTDQTETLGRALESTFTNVRFLKVPDRGVGLALKTSWSQSRAEIVGYMDLDLATGLDHFLEAYRAIVEKDYDLVYGTRLHPRSRVIGRTLKREISSRVFNWMLRNYLRVGFSDGMCGFKWLKREHYPALYEKGAQNNGWFFSTELLTVAEWLNLRIKELPVVWTDDVSSSRVEIWPLAKKYMQAMRELKGKRLRS